MGRSRGGLTSKIHALVDAEGRPITLRLTAGQVHDSVEAEALLDGALSDGSNRPTYTRSTPTILMVALLWPWAAFRQWSADLRSRRRRGRALLWLVLGPTLIGVLYLVIETGLEVAVN